MADVTVPLLSRQPDPAGRWQRAQHAVIAVALISEGGRRLALETRTMGLALAVAEIAIGLIVLAAIVIAAAWRRRRGTTEPRAHGIDWVDVAMAAMFGVDAWARHYETGHWPRPVIAMAGLTILLSLAAGPMAAFVARRRGLRLSNRSLSVGDRPFGRFTAKWVDLARIEVGERWAVIATHDGRERRIDLSDLRNEARVREALREAEILRTARKRFAPKDVAAEMAIHERHVAPEPAVKSAAVPPAPGSEPTVLLPSAPTFIERPTVIEAAGNLPKRIEEYAGRVNSGHRTVSVARMVSPEGWIEPGQRPEFEEITVVLRGALRVEHARGALIVRAGQAIVSHPGVWIRYSSPEPGGAEYVAICLPAFSPDTVHRDPNETPVGSSPAGPRPNTSV